MALYLKYRPKDFESLVGQDFVKETLQKAVETDKTVGAYLLCGPRGTGKTSTARIFAKAVNCENSKNGNPCNTCSICDAINTESLVDVIEIDAASHTGVDNIREIIEKAQFRPTNSKFKIYIIDEVHMLSKGAFNALLKILEEPPEYVKFILATTETHKVPETIISRCQRYDMKSISLDDIKYRLTYIAKEEKIKIDSESLDYISQNAGGALRNAISLFEQLATDNKIEFKDIIENLGIVEEDILSNFLDKLISKDNSVVGDFEQLISDGKNVKLFFKELLFYTKKVSLNLIKNSKDISSHLHILDVLDSTYSKTKVSLDENTTFLIGILKIITDYSPVIGANNGGTKVFTQSVVQVKNADKTPKANTPKKEISTPEISAIDVGDIFGDSEPTTPKSAKETLLPETKATSDFNTTEYLSHLKKNGAKAMVTLSIKGASISLNDKNLELKFKTKFALNSVNNPDTIALLNKGLIDMGMSDVTVKLIG
ncbi:DNA polymerase III subunit gamma/tau [Candidatus Gracilibacteria bacterium]|nr:DNA polymerase III subunit gamma/tau [Candidatus Gracilibacteria bacterium]